MANNLPPSHRPRGPEHAAATKRGVDKRQLFSSKGDALMELPDGRTVTRRDYLYELQWLRAVGYDEKVRDEFGTLTVIHHEPSDKTAERVLNYDLGKPVAAETAEDPNRIKAADKLDDLVKAQLNQIVDGLMAQPTHA